MKKLQLKKSIVSNLNEISKMDEIKGGREFNNTAYIYTCGPQITDFNCLSIQVCTVELTICRYD